MLDDVTRERVVPAVTPTKSWPITYPDMPDSDMDNVRRRITDGSADV
jgi:hypothetical protein